MKRKIATSLTLLGASALAMAQEVTLDDALTKTTSILRGSANNIINLISIIIGIISVVMLSWQLAKYFKGNSDSNDSLMKIRIGMLIAAVLLQVIRAVFIR